MAGDAEAGTTWSVEQVLALAPRPSSVAGAQPLAVPSRWSALGCDGKGVWGRCSGSSAEPYETVVDHLGATFRCTCPSRVFPCKHTLALLLLWVRGLVPAAEPVGQVATWLARRADSGTSGRHAVGAPAGEAAAQNVSPSGREPAPGDRGGRRGVEGRGGGVTEGVEHADVEDLIGVAPPGTPPDTATNRDERVARMHAGLAELDRWLADRLRTGLADPALARYATWDALAARLVDAQVGGLANRVRRLGGAVGRSARWHEHVLAELGLLHLVAVAARRLGELPVGLVDAVAVAAGWQIRQADVLAGVPDTDRWMVAGRSDVREDRIEVRRTWLRGRSSGRWAMVLSFAAFRQTLDDSLPVGTEVHADLYRYPGALRLRALVGLRHSPARVAAEPIYATVAGACDEVGKALAAEPWIDRFPFTALVAAARDGGSWALTDGSGSLPVVADHPMAPLLACSGGRAVPVTCEWTPAGVVPLTVHLPDRAVDIGPTADPGFVAGGTVSGIAS